jgi:hypothetical protein
MALYSNATPTFREQIERLEGQYDALLATAEAALDRGDIAAASQAQADALSLAGVLEGVRRRAAAAADEQRTQRQIEAEVRARMEREERERQATERKRIGRLLHRLASTTRWQSEVAALHERAVQLAARPPVDVLTEQETADVLASEMVAGFDLPCPSNKGSSRDLSRAATTYEAAGRRLLGSNS